MTSDFDLPTTSSLRSSTWSTPVLLGGLVFLLVWRSAGFLNRDMLMSIPGWLLLTLTGILPQLFLLLYPLLTRRQVPPGRFLFLPAIRLLIEAAISIPVVIATVVSLVLLQSIVHQLWPGLPLESKATESMKRSSGSMAIYMFLLISMTYGPFAEEIFFRGFLFNTFRKRMPLIFAGIVSSLIFGFCHFFGPAHAIATTLIGFVLTAIYWWRQTIVAPIFVHIGFNTFAAASLLLAMEVQRDAAFLGVNSQREGPCVVTEVTPNSPAELAGIQVRDTLILFDTHPIQDFQQLLDTIRNYKPGDSISVTVLRNEQSIDVDVILTSRRALSIK